jgi:hypothetical protein
MRERDYEKRARQRTAAEMSSLSLSLSLSVHGALELDGSGNMAGRDKVGCVKR